MRTNKNYPIADVALVGLVVSHELAGPLHVPVIGLVVEEAIHGDHHRLLHLVRHHHSHHRLHLSPLGFSTEAGLIPPTTPRAKISFRQGFTQREKSAGGVFSGL